MTPPEPPESPEARTCTCERPLPRATAARKGAVRTTCERCGLPIPLKLGAA